MSQNMNRHRCPNKLQRLQLRLKALLVMASDLLLLPICPTVLLTMHLLSSNAPNSTSAPLIIDHSERMTWRDYLMGNSVEQEMRGNRMEETRSMEIFKKMEVYFKSWVTNTKDTRLIQQCVNKHRLCVYWASIQECTSNPVYMEDICILACQQCNKLTNDMF